MENCHTAVFYDLISTDLKDPSIDKEAPKLFKNGIYLYPEEIKPYMSHKNPYVNFYAKALMVNNIISAPVVKPEFIDYILVAESFTQQKPENLKAFYFHLDQAASVIIRKLVERLDPNTKKMAQLASKIKSIDQSFVHSFLAMQLKLSYLISEMQLKVFTDINDRIIVALLNNLDYYSNLGFDVEISKVICISPIITFIQIRNGIIPGYEKHGQNVELDRKILVRVRDILNKVESQNENEDEAAKKERKEMFDFYQEDIKKLLYKLEYQEAEDDSKPKSKFRTVKVKVRRIPKYMEVKMISIDSKRIFNLNSPFYEQEDGSCKISFCVANFEKINVILKIYEPKINEVLGSIYADAKIHQILSQNISDEKSCFLKYYGTILEENKITLVMETFQDNLSVEIKKNIDKNRCFNNAQIATWMSNLIKSLQIMDKLNIYHGDISINNISIDKELNLKFINFKPQDGQETSKVQGVNKENSNESENRFPEKPLQKDIYALGIVFLQILTLQNIPDYSTEDGKDKVLELTETIKESDKKNLVKMMLEKNPKTRAKLITINQVMEPIETRTRASSMPIR